MARPHYDLLIRGGTLVDGSGAPPVAGDLGITDGRIAAVGDVSGDAGQTLDAEGAVVAPGFIDIHTHYDAQIFWDRALSPSPWHGVTSVVMGNCGFGVAPTRPEARELMMKTLENVEGMSLAALEAGLGQDWPFESFSEYLDAIEARGSAINVSALVGHTPVRAFVMGDEASEREAREDEIAQMRALVEEALAAGAMGFATSMSPTHVGARGRPVPSRAASLAEIDALADALTGTRGLMQATLGPGLFVDQFADIARRTGRPITWTALLEGLFPEAVAFALLEQHAKLQSEGLGIFPQVACRPLVTEFQLKSPFPMEAMPVMAPVSAADFPGRVRLYADPEFRRALRRAIDEEGFGSRFREMQLSEYAPDPSLCERGVLELAAERAVHVVDLVLDLALATDLEARFRIALANHGDENVGRFLSHPASVLGLSDAGAHASQLCDAGAPTTLLGKWVRERAVLSLEQAVWQLTGQPAELFGIRDRGQLRPGLAADVTLFEPEQVDCAPVRRVHDLPAGADRLVADAKGIRAVIVNGSVIRQEGRDTLDADGPLPGRLLRGGAAT